MGELLIGQVVLGAPLGHRLDVVYGRAGRVWPDEPGINEVAAQLAYPTIPIDEISDPRRVIIREWANLLERPPEPSSTSTCWLHWGKV